MVNHTFLKTRADSGAKRRERKGIFVCQLCGNETTALTGLVDPVTHIATCGVCIERTTAIIVKEVPSCR